MKTDDAISPENTKLAAN